MAVALWIVRGLLGLIFVIAGSFKFFQNKEKFIASGGTCCLVALMLLSLASSCTNQGSRSYNEKMIKDYYAAYEKKDWNMLNSLLADGFVFNSPNDDHIDLKTYKERCWPNAANIKRFDIEKLIVDGDDAFVTYNGWTTDGKLFRNTEYFKFKDGKIKENACFFGPGISFPDNTKTPGP